MRPLVSFVLATHNRRDVLSQTLDRVHACGLRGSEYEIIVVDNASTDGTPELLQSRSDLRAVPLGKNLGSCAKAVGMEIARADLLMLLDDDSFPRPGCMGRMISHFDRHPTLGAAGFTVHLPDGSQECSALPHVFVGCGVGLRRSALDEAGGLDRTFFMQAEEYDLSFRLLNAGWDVRSFADLQVDHLKSPLARRSERTTFHDVRNNLRVIARYLPRADAAVYRGDWLRRYRWMAEDAGHLDAFARGVSAGRWIGVRERVQYAHRRLGSETLEQLFCWDSIEERFDRLARGGARRVVLADLGKNVYAFWRGARQARMSVLAIADDRFARPGRDYRGVPIATTDEALSAGPDVVVVSNTSYVHAHQRARKLITQTSAPVCNWFRPPTAESDSVGEIPLPIRARSR